MSSENNLLILKLLLLMAFADKVYMEEEKELINEISEKLKIPDRKKQQIIEEVEQSKNITKDCREKKKTAFCRGKRNIQWKFI